MSTHRSLADRLSWISVNRLNMALLAGLILALMFQVGGGQTRCAGAQANICQSADSVDIAGDLTLRSALQVESTPTAGSSGEVLLSQGASSPPEWTDYFQELVKSADETVSASTVLQNDDDFSFTAAANAVYFVEWGFRVSENIAGAQDFKFNFTVPAGTVHCSAVILAAGAGDNQCGTNDMVIDTGDTTESLQPAWTIFEISATPGTVTMQWAQNAASNNTTLHQNSTMRVARIG